METIKILFAGFGGQGILFAGKLLATAALIAGKQLSWLPSYGPEMRGGTANCGVILSDKAIASPIVDKPDILIAMNTPSVQKYLCRTVAGGKIFYDSSLIGEAVKCDDAAVFSIPATKMASENSLEGLANMIMIGKLVKESGIVSYDQLEKAMKNVVPAKKKNLLELNMKAVGLGYNY